MIKYIKASPDANGFYTDEELDAFVKEQREKREAYYKEKAEADAKEREQGLTNFKEKQRTYMPALLMQSNP